jgi:hypothetical protein
LHRRLGPHFQIHGHNIPFAGRMAFLPVIQRNLRRRFSQVLDRANAYHKAVSLLQAKPVAGSQLQIAA